MAFFGRNYWVQYHKVIYNAQKTLLIPGKEEEVSESNLKMSWESVVLSAAFIVMTKEMKIKISNHRPTQTFKIFKVKG